MDVNVWVIVYKWEWGGGINICLRKIENFSLNSFKRGNGYRDRIKKIYVPGKFLMHRDIKYRLTGMMIKSIYMIHVI